MRIVVTSVPQTGHVTPLLPLARAFAEGGHDTIVASGPDAEAAVTAEGLTFRTVGPGFVSWFEALRARTRGLPGDGLHPSRIQGYFVPRLFAEIGAALVVDDLLDLCRSTHPDLVVFESYSLAAPLVAAHLGIRAVHHSIGPLLDDAVLDLAADAVSPIWREFGMDVPPAAGLYTGTTLTICPRTLDPAADSLIGARPLAPVAPPSNPPPPPPVERPDPTRSLAYLTLGTFSNNDVGLFRQVLDALRDEPLDVVATIGRDNDPTLLDPVPPNARIECFIPQADLLPHCNVVVHHAGAGTMFGVLAHGLPSVVLPQSADNFTIAARLAAAGVARVLPPDEVSVESIRSALHEVLTEPTYGDSARELAHEIAAMPSAAEVALDLTSGMR